MRLQCEGHACSRLAHGVRAMHKRKHMPSSVRAEPNAELAVAERKRKKAKPIRGELKNTEHDEAFLPCISHLTPGSRRRLVVQLHQTAQIRLLVQRGLYTPQRSFAADAGFVTRPGLPMWLKPVPSLGRECQGWNTWKNKCMDAAGGQTALFSQFSLSYIYY